MDKILNDEEFRFFNNGLEYFGIMYQIGYTFTGIEIYRKIKRKFLFIPFKTKETVIHRANDRTIKRVDWYDAEFIKSICIKALEIEKPKHTYNI